MQIKPSTALRNDYSAISALANELGEPIYITKNGEGDLVVMSIDAFEDREKKFSHRAAILEAELARLSGEPTYSLSDVKAHLKEKYFHE
ncbi:MAG: type II toxin-antitoxin system Phd/YefM family antitoxin [Treponema sp.]|jgi:prevent-host-death family protein|nr:type II toxin-antitoxin system Phd/YefM family antitoxin [Treponema sp.]